MLERWIDKNNYQVYALFFNVSDLEARHYKNLHAALKLYAGQQFCDCPNVIG
jgi:hypothetical protein